MPDYGYTYEGYRLYFTSKCITEPMHAHVDQNYSSSTSAKIWIKENGDSVIQDSGKVPKKVLKEMQVWISKNYLEMAIKWNALGGKGFFVGISKI